MYGTELPPNFPFLISSPLIKRSNLRGIQSKLLPRDCLQGCKMSARRWRITSSYTTATRLISLRVIFHVLLSQGDSGPYNTTTLCAVIHENLAKPLDACNEHYTFRFVGQQYINKIYCLCLKGNNLGA